MYERLGRQYKMHDVCTLVTVLSCMTTPPSGEFDASGPSECSVFPLEDKCTSIVIRQTWVYIMYRMLHTEPMKGGAAP
jgi:hypothetical protein